jgi:predicted acyl esterase|eukprot:COSAG02_NODE_5741_length_4076_cov_6.010561_3_plen_66_part_00
MHYYDGSEMIDVPALHVSTWYDPSVLESIDSFNYFREHAVTAQAAEHQYVTVSMGFHSLLQVWQL